MSSNSKKILNVPNLRFKEFSSAPWKKRKIGDEMYIKSRIGWQALTRDEYLDNGDYYLVTGTDFTENNTIDFNKCYYVSKERYEMDDKIQLKAGDLIVTKDGTIGKVAYIESLDKPATLNSHLFVLRDQSGEISSKYLLYVLSSYVFKDFVNSIKTGSTLTGLPQKDMIKFEYGYPSILEQDKITEFLTLIDKRIETQSKIIEDLKTLKKSIDYSLFNKNSSMSKNGKVTSLRCILLERNIYAQKNDSYEHVTLSKDGILPKGERYNRDFLVKDDEKKYKITKLDDICYNPANLKFGVLCMNKYGEAIFSPIYVTYEIKPEFEKGYIEHAIINDLFIGHIRKYEEGTVYERMAVSSNDFLKGEIAIPSNEIQKKIANVYKYIENKLDNEKQVLEKFKEQKQYLLNNLFI